MNRSVRPRLLSLDDIKTEAFSSDTTQDTTRDSQYGETTSSEPDEVNSWKTNNSISSGSYIVDYGPIRVRHRRSLSQTLATGRRSKDEQLEGEEAIKRELRRAKNRIAARRLKRVRDKIEYDLLQKINELEHEEESLKEQHQKLEERKAKLNRAVYNAKQAPLIPLITDIDMPLLFGPQDRHDLLIDLQPLLKILDEQTSLSKQ